MNVTCRFNLVTQIYYHSNIIWVCSTTSCRSCDPESDVAPSKHQGSSSSRILSLPRHGYTESDVHIFPTLFWTSFFHTTLLQPTSEDIIADLHRCLNSTGYRQFFNLQNIYIYNYKIYAKKILHFIILPITEISKPLFSHFTFLTYLSFTYLPNMAIMPAFV